MEEILNSNGVILINSSFYFTIEERNDLKQTLEENNMEMFFLEQRGFQNSIFSGIEIILNNNLFNMIIGGLIMPAAYDVLKKSLADIIKKLRRNDIKLLRANRNPEPVNAVIKIKTDVGEIIASIDQELSIDEVEKYMQALVKAFEIASNTPNNKNQYFIVDKTSDNNLEVLLLSEYLKKYNKI